MAAAMQPFIVSYFLTASIVHSTIASILNYFGVAFAVFHLAGVVMGFKAPKIKKMRNFETKIMEYKCSTRACLMIFIKKTYGLSESFTVGQLSAVKVWGDFVKDY